jgi:hypothetical protein
MGVVAFVAPLLPGKAEDHRSSASNSSERGGRSTKKPLGSSSGSRARLPGTRRRPLESCR